MADTPDEDAARELARLVVSQVAPEELPLFPVLADASLADPVRMFGSRDDVQERLGFGVGETVALITPYAVLAATEAVKYLTKLALDAGTAVATRFLAHRGLVQTGGSHQDRPLQLRAEQVQELRGIVRDKALQLGLAEPKADLLADAFAGAATLHDG